MTSIRPDGRVEFRFFRPNAIDVKVLGTFNDWDGDSVALESEGDGWWSAIAELDVGEHRFRYWVDGHWFTDFASHGVEMGRYGWNSVLVVPEMKTAASIQTAMKIEREVEYETKMKSAA
jgi:1,4-alpha-glucan branching enzyme